MPNDNKNQNQGQRKNQDIGQGQQGGGNADKGQDQGRQEQGNRGQQQQGGNKDSTNIEREDVRQVGNDNDQDRDEDREEGEVTARNPRQGDQGQQGSRPMGNQGQDRDRNKQ